VRIFSLLVQAGEADINILIHIFFTHRSMTFITVITLIAGSNSLKLLSKNNINKLEDKIELWLYKTSNLGTKRIRQLKKEAGNNTILFILIMTILIIGGKSFNYGRFVEEILKFISKFNLIEVYDLDGNPDNRLVTKICNMINLLYKFGYLEKGYSSRLTHYNKHFVSYKVRRLFIAILSLSVTTVSSIVSNLWSRVKFYPPREKSEALVNGTKIFINAPYVHFLLDNIFDSFDNYLITKSQEQQDINFLQWEYNHVKSWLLQLLELSFNGTVPIYMKSYIDFRGRIYTINTYTFISTAIIRMIFTPTIRDINTLSLQLGLIFINKHLNRNFQDTNRMLSYLNDNFTLSNYSTYKLVRGVEWAVWFIILNGGALTVLQLDANCSGYQHYAYLTRDYSLAGFLGLKGEDYNYLDLYTAIGGIVIEKLKISNYPLYVKIMKLVNVDQSTLTVRSMAKKPIMIALYGAGLAKISNNLKVEGGLHIFSTDELDIISKTFISVVDYFTNNSSKTGKAFGLIVSLSDDHIVSRADGFIINNHYLKKSNYKGQVYRGNKDISLRFSIPTNLFDSKKCSTARFVNCIHRLDRLFILRIIERGIPILYIHDCIIISPTHLVETLTLALHAIDAIYINYTIIDLIKGVKGSAPEFISQQAKLLKLYEYINKDRNLKCSASAFRLNKGLDIKEVLNLCNK